MADAFCVASHGHLYPSDPDGGPDVSGSGEGKDETGKKDHQAGPLELAIFFVIKVRKGRFPEESDSQNHVQRGKNRVIDDRFDLSGGVLPGTPRQGFGSKAAVYYI